MSEEVAPAFPRQVGPLKATHGFQVSSQSKDGVRRIVQVQRDAEGLHEVHILTDFQDGGEPNITRVCLSKPAFNLLVRGLMEAQLNMDRWAYPKTEQQQN